MSTPNPLAKESSLAIVAPRPSGGLFRTAVLARLRNLQAGEVTLCEQGETLVFGRSTQQFPVRVTVQVLDGSLYRDIALGGDLAAAEAYMEGKWAVNDLTGLIRIFAANPTVLNEIEHGIGKILNPLLRLGHFLRRTRLDELPQLFNVIRGEMSLVGPRPIIEAELARYGDDVDYFLMVRPGMTGLWQVSGRNDVDYDTRVYLDTWYVKNWSLWYDIAILFKTVRVVFRREGAY